MEEEEEVEEAAEKEDEEKGTQRLVVSLSATTLNRPSSRTPATLRSSRFYPPYGNPRTEDKNQYERVAISL